MAKIWHGGYWTEKARSKKNSPWVIGALVVAALWAWGHTTGTSAHPHPGPGPSASSSASASAHAKK